MLTIFWILSFVQGFSSISAILLPTLCATCGLRAYITFDYNSYVFLGKECEYDMAHDCSGSGDFSVKGLKRLQNLTGTNELMLARITIEYDGETVVFNQIGRTIDADGNSLTLSDLPYTTNAKYTLTQVGFSVHFTSDDGSLFVAYNFRQNLLIELGDRWREKVCGLCGTFNGNKDDDIPEDTRDYELSAGCGPEIRTGVCRSEEDQAAAEQMCRNDIYAITECNDFASELWVKYCARDFCSGHHKHTCQYLMEFQDVCHRYVGDDAIFQYTIPSCQSCGMDRNVTPTITPLLPDDSTDCGREGGFCLDPDCEGCIRPFKEGLCPADQKCCPNRMIPPFCATSGFRHYITMDFNFFRYMGKECVYDLAHDCSSPRRWEVTIKKKIFTFRGTKELMISSVKIRYDGAVILFKLKHRKVKVPGYEWKLKDLPVYTDPSNRFTVQRVGYTARFLTRDEALMVTFNFRQLVVVDVGEKWRGKVCGICDTFDGDRENDLPKDPTDFELGHHCGHEIPYGTCRSDELRAEAEEICNREFLAVPGCNIMYNDVWLEFCALDYCSGGNKYLCQILMEFGDYCHKILGVDAQFQYVPESCQICNMDRSTAPQYSSYNAYEDYDCELVGGNCISPTCDGCIHPFSDLQCPKGRKCCPDRPGKKATIISQIQSAP